MGNSRQDNSRIAKNTLMLYFRMFLVLIVTFFTFRLLLQELGEKGYGTYNVVGGVIVLFSFLSSALTQSTQRFMSFYLGRKDNSTLTRVYSTSINVHLLISLGVIILAETVGLWFLNSKMSFPESTQSSINWLFQCSIIAFVLQIMTVPFQALIISHEKMSFYAYFSIFEVTLKLSAVLILFFIENNKLIIYSTAVAVVYFLVLLFYYSYCRIAFTVCRYKLSYDKVLFKDLTSFSGWNMLGGVGNVAASQGVNIMFNLFCGVIVNAAMGVANHVGGAVSSFVTNLQTAFNPQIIKTYAEGNIERFNSLVFRSSKYSFLLIFTLGLPVVICCKTVLNLWLTEVPVYAVSFTQLMICFCMIDAISGSLWTAAQASGRIKHYMLIIATMIFTNLPAAYILLWLDLSPVWVMAYKVSMNLVIHFVRIIYLHHLMEFPSIKYCLQVMLPILIYIIVCLPLPILLYNVGDSILWELFVIAFTMTECAAIGFIILFTKGERKIILSKIKTKIHL